MITDHRSQITDNSGCGGGCDDDVVAATSNSRTRPRSIINTNVEDDPPYSHSSSQ